MACHLVWTIAGILLIGPLGINLSEILIEINIYFHSRKCIWKCRLQNGVCSSCPQWVNSLWPSDTIWRQRSWSTLAQVTACCLTTPRHYLNQCWLVISKVELHSSKGKFTRVTSAINHWEYLLVKYRKTSNIRHTLVGNKIVDHSDVVGASPVGAAPTTSSFST